MMPKLLQKLLGSYCPDEWKEREDRTASAVDRARVVRVRSERVVGETARRIAGMVDSYKQADERLRRP